MFKVIKNYGNKKFWKKLLEDHAGERGAIKIYEGQLLALKHLNKTLL